MHPIESKTAFNDGKRAVLQLCSSLSAALHELGADPAKPQVISRRFGIDKSLSWRIARAVREEDAWAALPHIPGRPGIGIFLEALAAHGAGKESIDAVWAAQDAFEAFIARHAKDRETLQMMVAAAAADASDKRMEAFRKDGSQAASALLGLRAGLHLSACFVQPGTKTDMVDIAVVSGLVGFSRLRPDALWSVATFKNWGGDPESVNGAATPIDPTVGKGETPFLRDFCTQPLPDVRAIETQPGVTRFMMRPCAVGFASAADVFSGSIYRNTASVRESYPGERGEYGTNLIVPSEALVLELFLHRDIPIEHNITTSVYSMFPDGPQYPESGSDALRLPVPTTVIDLGFGDTETRFPEFPRYRELREMVAARLGKPLAEFHRFRYRLRYPPIPTLAVLSHPLRPA